MSKEEHELLLRKIKPYPFYTDEGKKVYIKVVNVPTLNEYEMKDGDYRSKGELSNGDDIIHISLINEDMLNYDAYFFQEKNKKAYYRPYFYEFYAESNFIDKNVLSFLMKNQGRWMTGKFYSDEIQNKQEYSISGYIFFSASPFKIARRALIITDKTVPDKINEKYLNTYDTSNAVVSPSSTKYFEMKRIIDQTIGSSNDFYTRIYNVGQGNCVYIKTSENKRILFDIGYNKNPASPDWKDYRITRSKYAIMHMKPHLNILSHWDMDHILGVMFSQKNMFDHPWIAPNLNELSTISVSAARLAKYLCWKNQLYLVNDKFLGSSVYCSNKFKLWRGVGRNNTLNKANNFGLIIELIGNKRMLLPGDCEYKMFPIQLDVSLNRYNYLMVPHHCSKMELPHFFVTPSCNDCAIISVGHNLYNPRHPYANHIKDLNRVKYKTIQTVGIWCIDIPSINRSTFCKVIF